MNRIAKFPVTTALLGSLLAVLALPGTASAAPVPSIAITEVAPWGSGSSYAADWFELTNTGASSVDISGWKMDDNSNTFANAVALRGVTSIAAGQSVIFLEGTASGLTAGTAPSDATINANFLSAWFGPSIPAGVTLGNYGGSGVGLGAGAAGDAVNIFDATGTLISNVSFGLATTGVSFDNAAGLSNTLISRLSVVGSNSAMTSYSGSEIGSPASIAAVPEPTSYAMLFAGLGLVGSMVRRRKSLQD
jgi:hypothetical protein